MNIKEARKEAGLSQLQMSEQLGIPRRTIEDWERGVRIPAAYVEKLVVEKLLSMKNKPLDEEEITLNGRK